MRFRRATLLVLHALVIARSASAGTEEFSTFSVIRQEGDDESLIDHVLTRPPQAWRDEWERAPQGLRTSQGCLTSGQWFIDTQLKVRAPLGQRARFGVDLKDEQSDRNAYTYFDLSFRAGPTGIGTPGFWFRPMFDKSRQDLGLFWELGQDTADNYARFTFVLEDAFNNLWEFRQSRVGESNEPYEKHPFEPAIRFHLWRPRWRVEIEGHYLTPSVKRLSLDSLARRASLWGTYGRALIEMEALGIRWSAATANRQARSVGPPTLALPVDVADFRRQWGVDLAATRRFGADWEADLRWIYQSRDQEFMSAGNLYLPTASFDALDRVVQAEARYAIAGPWWIRAGGMVDKISMTVIDPLTSVRRQSGSGAIFTRGSRTESRAYLGFAVRFGSVSLSAVEGFELDSESYEVWWVHDKAFAQLQAVF